MPGPEASERPADPAVPSFRETFLEAVLQSATDFAILAIGLDGLVTAWNEGARRVLGWTEAEMLGRPARLIFTAEDVAAGVPEDEMRVALSDGRGMDERWHVRHDGTRFWANGEMMPLRSADGVHIGFLKILRDRTQQRLDLERQRADAAFMRSVLESSADCIKVLDLDANLLAMNEGGRRVMEVSDFNAIQGCPWPDFWAGEGNAQVRAAIAAARGGGIGRFQGTAETMAGRLRHWDVQVTPILDAEGRPEKLVAISRDVSATVLGERALRDSEDLRRLAVEAGNIGTWAFTVASRSLQCDARCKALFGLPPEAVVTYADYLAALHPGDRARVLAATRLALDAGASEAYHVEHRAIARHDGVERWVALTGRTDFKDGRAVRMLGTVMDVTARRQAEQQARLLADELQHRVKNTLALVQAIVHQTLRSASTPAEAQAALSPRLVALGRAHDMLTQAKWEGSDLRAVLEAALKPHDDGAEGRFRMTGPQLWLHSQAAMSVALLLHELGTNAAKYGALSSSRGRVDIDWTVSDTAADACREFHLTWRERGGPPVQPPARRGFGSKLIERGLASAFGGSASLTFARDGLVCRVDGRVAASDTVPS